MTRTCCEHDVFGRQLRRKTRVCGSGHRSDSSETRILSSNRKTQDSEDVLKLDSHSHHHDGEALDESIMEDPVLSPLYMLQCYATLSGHVLRFARLCVCILSISFIV